MAATRGGDSAGPVPRRRFWPAWPRHLLTLAMGAALAVAVMLTLAAAAWYERSQALDRVSERNELMARVFADGATRSIEGTALALATLAELIQRGMLPESQPMRAALDQTLVNLPFLRGLAVVDAQGLVLGSTDATERGLSIDLSGFGAPPAPGRDQLGRYVPVRRLKDLAPGRTGAPVPRGVGVLPLVRTVQLAGGAKVRLLALINPDAFATFQQTTLDSPDAAAALLSYDGRLIAATAGVGHAPGDDLSGLPPFSSFLPRLERGSWRGAGLRDAPQLAAFNVSATRPLVVIAEYPMQAALAQWARQTRALAVAGVAAALLIGAMTWVASRSVRARERAQGERDTAQQETARRARELSITLASLQELVFRTDADGAIVFANHRWQQVLGRDPAAAKEPLFRLVSPEHRDAVRALFDPAAAAGVQQLPLELTDLTGARRHYDLSVMALLKGGRLTGFAGSAIEVTDREQVQQRLQAQLSFTRQLMDASPLPNSVIDPQRHYLYVNRAWEAFTGRRREDVIGTEVGAHLPADERALHEAHDQEVLRTGEPVRYEASATRADGQRRDLLVNKLLLPGPDGRAAGVLVLQVDVTEFRLAERATREARDAAEETSRAKSEFIANISHELRTPLQSIIGFSELGRVRGREQPRLADMFGDIHAAGQRMLALVNDLLDVAKIESTVGTIHLERSDLRPLVRAVAGEFAPQLASRHLRLELSLPEVPMRAKVDPLRFQQVVRNVLANAVRFSPDAERIDVVGECIEAGELRLTVADRGPGIPPGELEKIFEAFVQSSLTKNGSGGTGLGLAICRKIVDAHGGRIHARNRPQGGAEFDIVLPARGIGETMPAPLT